MSKDDSPSKCILEAEDPRRLVKSKRYMRPDVKLSLKVQGEFKRSNLEYINQKHVRKYYGKKVVFIKKGIKKNQLKHYLKDFQNLSISQNRRIFFGDSESDDDYDDSDDNKKKRNALRAKYDIKMDSTWCLGKRVILGQDVKIQTKRNLKLLQRMVSYCHQSVKFEQLKTIELLDYLTNVKTLNLKIKSPDTASFNKPSLRRDALRSLESLDLKLSMSFASKRGGWKAKEPMALLPFLESLCASKLLTSPSFQFKFNRFTNDNAVKGIGAWLEQARARNFNVSVDYEAIDYAVAIIPLITFKPILKHCDLLRIFIRNDRRADNIEEEDELEEVPWLGPVDSAGSFEKKRKIVLTIFKDDNTPYRDQREDFREILASCENLKSLVFFTGAMLFTWGANEEYRVSNISKKQAIFLKKEFEDSMGEEDEDDDDDDEEEKREKVDEETLKQRKLEAEEKAKKCLQGLEEIVVACATITGDDNKEKDLITKFMAFMKDHIDFGQREEDIEETEDDNSDSSENGGQQTVAKTQKLPEFLKYFLMRVSENSCNLNYLSLCHSYCNLKPVVKSRENFVTTKMLADKDFSFESVKTIEVYPGEKDDYDELKSMLARIKNLNELVVNLRPFYRKQNITKEEVEEYLNEIRKILPNLNIKIKDEI